MSKKSSYLTTYQAALHVEGYLKKTDEPDRKQFWGVYDQFSAGRYGSIDRETGKIECIIMPEGLQHLWNIMSRIDVYTQNR